MLDAQPIVSTSSAQVASPIALKIPIPSSASSTTDPGPLSPDVVASLQLDLSWLDLPVSSSSSAASSSSSSSGAQTPAPATFAATLAQRRMHRPPLFRRRSKSLDDVDAEEADGIMEELLDERDRRGETARAALLPVPPLSARSTTASLTDSQATSMPNSGTSSTLSTLAGSERAIGSGAPLRAPTLRDAALPAVAADERLASWVRSASQDGSDVVPPFPSPASLARAIRLPLPPRQPYTPVLPSPLSTCSYTSQDDDADRESGFPFPPTPHQASFTPSTADTSRPQSEHSASPNSALKDLPSFTTASGGSLRRVTALPPRPAFQTFASASTVSSSATATAVGTPLTQPDGPPLRAREPLASPTPTRSSTEPLPLVTSSFAGPAAAQAAASPSAASTSSAVALASARARSHTRGTSASSLSYTLSSHSSHPRSGASGAPLTPPDGITTGPWQANASAAELAWHEVLSAKFGAGAGARASVHGGESGSSAGSAAFALPAAAVVALSGGGGAAARTGADTGSWGGGPSTGATGGAGTGAGGAPGKKSGWQGNELMGNAAAGGYAACTREALGLLLREHIEGVPLAEHEETVHVVEYGALNSRSCALVPPILAHFAEREARSAAAATTLDPDELLSFQVTHVDKPDADFRCLTGFLDAAPESYLRKSRADLHLDGRVFSTFAARPSGVKMLPKKSVSVGFSAMSLHWPSTDRKYRVAPATLAHGELMAFLSARASEFKPGGLLTLAYIARSEEAALAASSPGTYSPSGPGTPVLSGSPSIESAAAAGAVARPPSIAGDAASVPAGTSPPAQVLPRKKDIWAHLTSVLGKAIQRLVSTGLLKPQVARQLLTLPLHSRTPRQTQACLRASAHSWEILDSSIVIMSHPAWKGVEHGTVSAESWADQTIQLVKIFWEDEMRAVLRDSLGSRGACEWVLDCLWTVAKEKVEEQPPYPLDLEVQLVALRRRERPASVPSSPVDGAQPLPLGVSLVDVMKRVEEGDAGREGENGTEDQAAPRVGVEALSS